MMMKNLLMKGMIIVSIRDDDEILKIRSIRDDDEILKIRFIRFEFNLELNLELMSAKLEQNSF